MNYFVVSRALWYLSSLCFCKGPNRAVANSVYPEGYGRYQAQGRVQECSDMQN